MAECADRWSLRIGDAFPASYVSLVVAADRRDGEPAVLKLQFPGRESEHEAAALELWDGDGAIRLLDHDPERHALLLERCHPGTYLRAVGRDAAIDVMVGLLPRLWKPAGPPFRSLSEEAGWWADDLARLWERAGRPFGRRLLDAALNALHELAPTQGEQVLQHQDLHADNVLAARREPWLVIDPKPLLGEREFGIAPVVRSYELGHSRREVVYRLDRLTAELQLDRERARRWTLGQTIAWAFDGDRASPLHVQTAGWLLDAG